MSAISETSQAESPYSALPNLSPAPGGAASRLWKSPITLLSSGSDLMFRRGGLRLPFCAEREVETA